MKTLNCAAAFKLAPYTGEIMIGKNNYLFEPITDTFQMLEDDENIQSITYSGITFTGQAGIYENTEILFEGVFTKVVGNIRYYWINIYDLEASLKNSKLLEPIKFEIKTENIDEKLFSDNILKSNSETINLKDFYREYKLVENNILENNILGNNNFDFKTTKVVKIKNCKNKKFYNVIASTGDPLPFESSWIKVWESEFNQSRHYCESDLLHIDESQLGGNCKLVGGHSTFKSNPSDWKVSPGGRCYLTPICIAHNNDRENKKGPMKSVSTGLFLKLIDYKY